MREVALLNKKETQDVIIESKDIDVVTGEKKKQSIWTKEITFKRVASKGKQDEKPDKAKAIRLVGVDIGNSTIKIVEGQVKGEKVHVYNMFKIPTPVNVLGDGNVEQPASVGIVLKNSLKEHGIKIKNLSFTSESSTIISRELVVPYVDKESELKHLVEYEIQQFLAINLHNYVVKYMKIDDVIEDGIEKQKLLAVIYPKDIIASFKDVAESVQLKPYALDITNNAIRKISNLAKVINADLLNKDDINMFLDMGAKSINISIVNKGKLDFMRSISGGGRDIDRFVSDFKGIEMIDAEKLKKEEVNIGRQREYNEVNDGVIRVVDGWATDLSRIINFYANKESGKQIKHIYLCGGTAKLKGLDDYLESKVKIETTNIVTLDNVEFSKNIGTSTVEEYINALGALIRL